VVRYDRTIPPGGKGRITLEINSNSIRGKFEKKAVVWSDDTEHMSVALSLRGEIRPHVGLTPGGYLSLWGVQGKTIEAHIDQSKSPGEYSGHFRLETDLPQKREVTIIVNGMVRTEAEK